MNTHTGHRFIVSSRRIRVTETGKRIGPYVGLFFFLLWVMWSYVVHHQNGFGFGEGDIQDVRAICGFFFLGDVELHCSS
jgi:hypothetical protein